MNRRVAWSITLLLVTRGMCAEDAVSQATPAAVIEPTQPAPLSLGKPIVPPPMPHRSIAPSTNALPGESITLEDKGIRFTLFIPRSWSATAETTVTVHFHTVAWFVIQEHIRRGAKGPLVCFQLGEGSTVYREAFEDTHRFARVLRLVEDQLKKRGVPAGTSITSVDVSSFSAGYGAVRELVKSPEYFKVIQRIVLLDSMYAAYEEMPHPTDQRKPAGEQIHVWVPFARAAMQGEKTFVFTHSAVPTGKYASSSECALALLSAVGSHRALVEPDSVPAASDSNYPLRYRTDRGDFHVWGYGGEDAAAHLTHVRHMADVWIALAK